jgi:protease IV
MKKFLLGVLVGILALGLLIALGVGTIMAFAARDSRKVADLKEDSVLQLSLSGELAELPAPEIQVPLPGFPRVAKQMSVLDLHQMLRKAAKDDRIKALLLMPRRPSMGWAMLQETQMAITEFKKSGKPIYAHLSYPGTVDYLIASQADKIYVTADDVVDVKGLRIEASFFKGTADKLGVAMEVETAGKYKDAGTPYTRRDLSPESKEVYNTLLDSFFKTMVDTIATNRKKTPDEVRAAIDQGPWTASQAIKLGMIDGVEPIDRVESNLAAAAKRTKLNKIGATAYLSRVKTPVIGRRIALLVGQGGIMRGENDLATDSMLSGSLIKRIREVRDNDDVAGVVFRVNSGGGDAVASEEILREIKLLSQKKPLVVSFSDVAASGGYYVACTGDPIVAYPNTITGSIGVIFSKPNFKGLYDKVGITKDIMTRGKMAAYDSDYVFLGEPGRAKLKEMISEIYANFLDRVATARKKKPEEIHEVAQGRVWTGAQAKEKQLVDELGGLDTALGLVEKRLKEKGLPLVLYPPQKSWIELLVQRDDEAMAEVQMQKAFREKAKQYFGVEVEHLPVAGFEFRMPEALSVK